MGVISQLNHSSPNGDPLLGRRTPLSLVRSTLLVLNGLLGARLPLQATRALLGGAADREAHAGRARDAAALVQAGGAGVVAAVVGDVLGDGVLATDGARVDAVALAGFRHGVVARVEVLALLQVLGEVVGAGRELAIEAEEALLLGGEGL